MTDFDSLVQSLLDKWNERYVEEGCPAPDPDYERIQAEQFIRERMAEEQAEREAANQARQASVDEAIRLT